VVKKNVRSTQIATPNSLKPCTARPCTALSIIVETRACHEAGAFPFDQAMKLVVSGKARVADHEPEREALEAAVRGQKQAPSASSGWNYRREADIFGKAIAGA
jgi:hypothetical protein